MSSQSISPTQKQARRSSRFVEGPPATGADLLHQPSTSNELFLNILNEMDEFEKKKRQHRGSSSSVDSLVSPNGSPVSERRQSTSEREGRRSMGMGMGMGGRPSLDAVRGLIDEKKNLKIVGRLRALTAGRDREGKAAPYPGT